MGLFGSVLPTAELPFTFLRGSSMGSIFFVNPRHRVTMKLLEREQLAHERWRLRACLRGGLLLIAWTLSRVCSSCKYVAHPCLATAPNYGTRKGLSIQPECNPFLSSMHATLSILRTYPTWHVFCQGLVKKNTNNLKPTDM